MVDDIDPEAALVKYERITCPSFVNPPALTARAHFRREKNSDISNSEIYFLS